MRHLCNIRTPFCVIAAIIAALIIGVSVATLAQETSLVVASGTNSSSLLTSNDDPASIRVTQAQTGRPLEKITFLLDFTPYGKHAPFFAALEKGFWKDAGFDVTIIKGEGSATTISSYAAGAVNFAFSDTPTLILARSKGALVKVAGVIHDKSLYALGTLVENNIKTPQDLKGKRIGSQWRLTRTQLAEFLQS